MRRRDLGGLSDLVKSFFSWYSVLRKFSFIFRFTFSVFIFLGGFVFLFLDRYKTSGKMLNKSLVVFGRVEVEDILIL